MIIKENFCFSPVKNVEKAVVVKFFAYEITTLVTSMDQIEQNVQQKYQDNMPVIMTKNLFCKQDICLAIDKKSLLEQKDMFFMLGNQTFFIGNYVDEKLFHTVCYDDNMKKFHINQIPYLDQENSPYIFVKYK